ncbi:hypothetical protein Scep_008298 [Stephania cephalantha]|uniref:Uncharacterized protein n=1 Tax=Stephania cephalantha TaxID=152367 RepID=A0AAP0KBE5_9MAGN
MATVAADSLLGCIFEGCIAGSDNDIERRPYHRNCGCAMHKSRGSCCKSSPKNQQVSFPMRRARSESCLVAVAASNQSSPSSPSPVVLKQERTHLDMHL